MSKQLLKFKILLLSNCSQHFLASWAFRICSKIPCYTTFNVQIRISHFNKTISTNWYQVFFQDHQTFLPGYFTSPIKLMKEATDVCSGKMDSGDYIMRAFVGMFLLFFPSSMYLLVLQYHYLSFSWQQPWSSIRLALQCFLPGHVGDFGCSLTVSPLISALL
jgi:hypothetical protein